MTFGRFRLPFSTVYHASPTGHLSLSRMQARVLLLLMLQLQSMAPLTLMRLLHCYLKTPGGVIGCTDLGQGILF